MIITLSKSEESVCKQASNARYNFARSAGLTNQNVVDRSDLIYWASGVRWRWLSYLIWIGLRTYWA